MKNVSAGAGASVQQILRRLRELKTLSTPAANSEARIYIGFDKHAELARD